MRPIIGLLVAIDKDCGVLPLKLPAGYRHKETHAHWFVFVPVVRL
jgi:hypothetical protein